MTLLLAVLLAFVVAVMSGITQTHQIQAGIDTDTGRALVDSVADDALDEEPISMEVER